MGIGQLFEQIKAASVRQIQIEQAEVGVAGEGDLPALAGGVGLKGPVTIVVEKLAKTVAQGAVVFDKKDGGGGWGHWVLRRIVTFAEQEQCHGGGIVWGQSARAISCGLGQCGSGGGTGDGRGTWWHEENRVG